MAGTICPTSCGTLPTITNYFDGCAPQKRGSGGSYLMFIRCDAEITDPSAAGQYATAAAAGQAFCSPCGTWTSSAPTQDIIETDGCGSKYNQSSTFNIDFTTYEFATSCDDVKFFKQLEDQQAIWRVVPVTCQDYYWVTDEAFDFLCDGGDFDGEIGVPFTFSVTPYQDRPGNANTLASWKFQLEVNKRGVYCEYPIDGALEAVCG